MESQSNHESKSVTTPSLPQDIIEEILSRLAVKPLLKLRCVSKSWSCLIGSERFIKTHHQNSKKNTAFPHQRVIMNGGSHKPKQCSLQSLLGEISLGLSPLDYQPNYPSKSCSVVGICNGLVCVLEEPGGFSLWNPSTRISKKLPEITNQNQMIVRDTGFGWVESSNEYKVFAIFPDQADEARVYSSKTNSWKTVPQLGLPVHSTAGIHVGGKLHWKRDKSIVWFDLKSEVFGMFEMPFIQEDLYYCTSLGTVGGCLCVLKRNLELGCERRGIRVCVMNKYGVEESWERVGSLPDQHLQLQHPFSAPLVVGAGGEILLALDSRYVVYYHHDHAVFRYPKYLHSLCINVCIYVESLVSP